MQLHDNSRPLITPFTGADEDVSTDVPRILQTRGVTWVVKWAAAAAALVSSAAVLVEFGYCLMAEQTLARAARAGAIEATLPRAAYSSVEQTVWRRLNGFDLSPTDVSLRLEQNAKPVSGKLAARGGDRFSIRLAVATNAVLPRWVRAMTMRSSGAQIVVQAEERMPGSALR